MMLKAKAIRFTTWDSNIQLTVAFVVNCLLLILGGALFYGTNSELGKFVDLFDALKNPDIVGNIASPVLSILLQLLYWLRVKIQRLQVRCQDKL